MASSIDRLETLSGSEETSLGRQFMEWFHRSGHWYLTSAVVHAIGFVIFAIIVTFLPPVLTSLGLMGNAPSFEAAEVVEASDFVPDVFPIGPPSLEPDPNNLASLNLGGIAAQEAQYYDESETFEKAGGGRAMDSTEPLLGGLSGFSIEGVAGVGGLGGVGSSKGDGNNPGVGGGTGFGFGERGKGHREAIPGGPTATTDRAVVGGLHWLYRHQLPNGNWSLQHNHGPCKGCSGEGSVQSDSAATAMALLPFLGYGQTHKARGPFQRTVQRGVTWLVRQQNKADGDLSGPGKVQQMYAHGLATLALCEAYGLTKDQAVGEAAAKAVHFIERAQNESTGGWRYHPGDDGDTSVTGWQMMALKSGQIAGLGVNSMSLENVRKWLSSVAEGEHHGLFKYQPYDNKGVTPTMTAVGMLCHQYLGMARDDAAMLEGQAYLMKNLPDPTLQRNVYYWYYSTMTMHNLIGPEWDAWNRQMRKALVTTQESDEKSCANGSWDPEKPAGDTWGNQGGRLMVTSLSVLTLEVYYRYLPLYKINTPPTRRK